MLRRTVVASLMVCVWGFASSAGGQQSAPPDRISITSGGQQWLGVKGHFDYGYGMVVDRVRWASPAGRIGLEPGDVIRAINGRWLRTENDFNRQLRDSDGLVQLVVEDVRTGRLISRAVNQ
jgi:S1-C subfamily serine protease